MHRERERENNTHTHERERERERERVEWLVLVLRGGPHLIKRLLPRFDRLESLWSVQIPRRAVAVVASLAPIQLAKAFNDIKQEKKKKIEATTTATTQYS